MLDGLLGARERLQPLADALAGSVGGQTLALGRRPREERLDPAQLLEQALLVEAIAHCLLL